MASELMRKRFTIHDYHRMADVGILGEDDRVELIDGEIVEMAAISSKHSGCVNTCNRLCSRILGDSALIAVQNPIQLGLHYEPQPDLAILHPRDDDYRGAHPVAADIFLLIEVADRSFDYDHTVKLPLYAAANIPEVWLIDLNRQRILRYSEPHEGSYRLVRQFRIGRQITSLVLPNLSLAVGAIFGM